MGITLLQPFYLISLTSACFSTYTIASGPRTLYYSPSLGLYLPTIIIPPSVYIGSWVYDPEANWVWWTISLTSDTITFKDTFVLTQWAFDHLISATLKIAADDYFQVVLNGVTLKYFDAAYYNQAYLVYNIRGIVRGASETTYQENELEVRVVTDGAFDGLIYRIDFTFA